MDSVSPKLDHVEARIKEGINLVRGDESRHVGGTNSSRATGTRSADQGTAGLVTWSFIGLPGLVEPSLESGSFAHSHQPPDGLQGETE